MSNVLLLSLDREWKKQCESVFLGNALNWRVELVQSVKEAQTLLESSEYDVLVCDHKLARVRGKKTLQEISECYPDVLRLLSIPDQELETEMDSYIGQHQVISHPVDFNEVLDRIQRSKRLEDLLNSEHVAAAVSRIKKLPSYPEVFSRLRQVLAREYFMVSEIADVVGQDAAMVAKVLQLANSAFFGVRQRVTNISMAVTLLGVSKIKSLVLAHEIFSQYEGAKLRSFDHKALWKHSLQVSKLGQQIARDLEMDDKAVEEAYVIGVIHDIGKLALASSLPDDYDKVVALAKEKGASICRAEQIVFETDHAAVGAFILSLWGLPDSIIEAVAYHHAPIVKRTGVVDLPEVVFLANYYAHSIAGDVIEDQTQIYFEQLIKHYTLEDRREEWETSLAAIIADAPTYD